VLKKVEMHWQKRGLIYAPDGSSSWAKNSALQPTPILMGEQIRVYVGFRDEKGISRVGFVDVDAYNPSRVLNVSSLPALDVGEPGAFDSNGVVPTAIVERDEGLYLYYAGYQIPSDVRFIAFGGMATSQDCGSSFIRKTKAPVMDRTDEALLFRVPHSVMFDGGVWKIWYGAGSTFIQGKAKTLPMYDIRYVESEDGFTFGKHGKVCIQLQEDEYRVGRPFVIKDGGIYKMFYGSGSESRPYRLGYAESPDGISWVRQDRQIGIDLSEEGWDSQMIAYPSIVRFKDATYLFYNGNNYGRDGFGYAVLEEW
jgi:hypothetical protein